MARSRDTILFVVGLGTIVVIAASTGLLVLSTVFGPDSTQSTKPEPVETPTPEVRTKVVTKEVVRTKTVIKTPTPEPADNPFGQDPLYVTLKNDSVHQREEIAAAVHYWNTDGQKYLSYDLELRLTTNKSKSEPIVQVAYTDSVGEICTGKGATAVGCTQGGKGKSGAIVTLPAVYVKTGMGVCKSIITVKHEFGHILGVSHDEGPEFMSPYYKGCHK